MKGWQVRIIGGKLCPQLLLDIDSEFQDNKSYQGEDSYFERGFTKISFRSKWSFRDMKVERKLQRTRILLGLAISFWLLWFPAYLHFYSLEEADFLSLNPNWGNPDQEGLVVSLDKKGKLWVLTRSPIVPLLVAFPFDPFLHNSPQENSHDESLLILRC